MSKKITSIPVSKITPGNNDRTQFDPQSIADLAASIKFHGRLIQPITVRRIGRGRYEIVAGERRYRAIRFLGWETIDSIIVTLTDDEAAAVMLAENTSRKDLDPIDEARAYFIRLDKYEWTMEQLSESAGRTPQYIRGRLKLLTLRDDLQSLVRSGNLQIGYAQILADAALDHNRQSFATRALRDNPRPTPGWFRNLVNQYAEQQNQAGLFDTSSFLVCQEIKTPAQRQDPPHPSTTTPPVLGSNPSEIITYQVEFWTRAATAWDEIGKPFKRQECEAAAAALSYMLGALS